MQEHWPISYGDLATPWHMIIVWQQWKQNKHFRDKNLNRSSFYRYVKVYLLPDHTKARKIHFQILKTDVYQFEQNSSEYFIDKTINLNWQDHQSILTKLSIFLDKLSIFIDKTINLHCKDYQSLLTELSIFIDRPSNLNCQAGKRKTRVRKHSLSPVFDEMLRVISKNWVVLSIHWHFHSLWCLWKQYGRGRCGCQYGTGAYPWTWKNRDK